MLRKKKSSDDYPFMPFINSHKNLKHLPCY